MSIGRPPEREIATPGVHRWRSRRRRGCEYGWTEFSRSIDGQEGWSFERPGMSADRRPAPRRAVGTRPGQVGGRVGVAAWRARVQGLPELAEWPQLAAGDDVSGR